MTFLSAPEHTTSYHLNIRCSGDITVKSHKYQFSAHVLELSLVDLLLIVHRAQVLIETTNQQLRHLTCFFAITEGLQTSTGYWGNTAKSISASRERQVDMMATTPKQKRAHSRSQSLDLELNARQPKQPNSLPSLICPTSSFNMYSHSWTSRL